MRVRRASRATGAVVAGDCAVFDGRKDAAVRREQFFVLESVRLEVVRGSYPGGRPRMLFAPAMSS
jgi:hypothetical protein